MRNYFLFIAVFLTIAITLGSLISIQNVAIKQTEFSDKFVHVFAYSLLTLSWIIALKIKTTQKKGSIILGSVVFIYGIIIEALQGVLTNSRQADWYDMFANLVGISMAIVFFNIFFQKKQLN